MKISFVDSNGQIILGVVALRNGVAVAADNNGNGYLKLDPGAYIFKIIGYNDKQYQVITDAEVTLDDANLTYDQVEVIGYRSASVWLLALLIVVVGYSIDKIKQ